MSDNQYLALDTAMKTFTILLLMKEEETLFDKFAALT